MRAVVVQRRGGPDVLRVVQLPVPAPRGSQVLVKVAAAGVAASDRLLRTMPLAAHLVRQLRGAAIAGLEFSGTVVAAGPEAGLAAGATVYGALPSARNGGTYCEYLVADENWMAPKPPSLSFAEAAVVPVGAMTAWEMVHTLGAARAGQRVVVNGATGGIGMFALQIGRLAGCHVTAVCGARNAALARELGADTVLDYRTQDLAAAGTYDVIVDAVGMDAAAVRRLLTPGGAYVTAVFNMGTVMALRLHGVRAVLAMVRPTRVALERLTALIEKGALRVVVDRTYPLEEAVQAQERHFGGAASGRVVLQV